MSTRAVHVSAAGVCATNRCAAVTSTSTSPRSSRARPWKLSMWKSSPAKPPCSSTRLSTSACQFRSLLSSSSRLLLSRPNSLRSVICLPRKNPAVGGRSCVVTDAKHAFRYSSRRRAPPYGEPSNHSTLVPMMPYWFNTSCIQGSNVPKSSPITTAPARSASRATMPTSARKS